MRRGLALVICWVAMTDAPDPAVRFVHPRASIVLAGPRGTDVIVQTRVPRDPDNRGFLLVWDGPGCHGSWAKTLDGENEPGVLPVEPMRVHVAPGVCAFRAAVYADGARLRASADFALRVCGGDGEC